MTFYDGTFEELIEKADDLVDYVNRNESHLENRLERYKDEYFENRESEKQEDLEKAMKARGKARELQYLMNQGFISKVIEHKDDILDVLQKITQKLEKLDQDQ